MNKEDAENIGFIFWIGFVAVVGAIVLIFGWKWALLIGGVALMGLALFASSSSGKGKD